MLLATNSDCGIQRGAEVSSHNDLASTGIEAALTVTIAGALPLLCTMIRV